MADRVAVLTPLPPETSGIADYSAELLPALAAHFAIDVFTAEPSAADESLRSAFSIHPYDQLPARDDERRYDAVVYQIGNSAGHHGPIYRALLERPGIVVLHEYMLHNLIRDLAAAGGGRGEFIEEMRYCYGQSGLAMASRLLHANDLPERWRFPLFERVVDLAAAVIVHGTTTRDRVLKSRPAARIEVVPHHLSLHGTEPASFETRARFCAELGVDPASFLVASFGHLTATKHLDVSLRAFARVRQRHPDAVYLLVGEVSHAYDELEELLAGELGRGVVTTGRVELERLLELMATCDVAVNLRGPTGGETSGACLRLLGLGRPIVVNDVGWFSEIPDDCCAKIRAGDDEQEALLTFLHALADDEALRLQLGRNAAEWASSHHRLEDSASGYAELIHEVAARPPVLRRPVPPLTRPEPGDFTSVVLGELAAAMGDLGITELDEEIQADVIETLAGVDLIRP